MKSDRKLTRFAVPLIVYALIITAIFVMKLFLSWHYVISVSALLMLSVPLFIKNEASDLRWDPRGMLTGLLASIVVLLIYVALIRAYGLYADKSLVVHKLSYSFILMQLLLVALPEEVFFRGYLQYKLGNNLKAVLVVSLLFALGHFITLCLGGDHGIAACSQAVLTFFPSIVMGYLYMATGTLWASIIFHFLANVVHVALGLA